MIVLTGAGAAGALALHQLRRSIQRRRHDHGSINGDGEAGGNGRAESDPRRSHAAPANCDAAGQQPDAPSGSGSASASAPPSPPRPAPCAPPPHLRGGSLVVFRDARGQGIVAHPAAGSGDCWELSATCAGSGVLRLRVADLGYSCAESVFVVEEAPGGLLAFRAIGAHGLPLVASSQRDAPHYVGPCPSSGGKQAGAAAMWRPSQMGLTNPKTGKRLGFAVVELFAVSSESLKHLEKAAADQHGTALAQVAALQAQLAASEAKRQEQEQAAALEWRRMHLETSRLSEELRRADSVQKEARAAANSAGLRVLQLEQRVGQLSTDKQAAAQALSASEARAEGLCQRLTALEAAHEKERRSWASDVEGALHVERAARAEELAAARKSLAELQESIAARVRTAAHKEAARASLAAELVSRDEELRQLAAANSRLDYALQTIHRHIQRGSPHSSPHRAAAERSSLSSISLGELRGVVGAMRAGGGRQGVPGSNSAADQLRLWELLGDGPQEHEFEDDGSESDSGISSGSRDAARRSGAGESRARKEGQAEWESPARAVAGRSKAAAEEKLEGGGALASARSVDVPPQPRRSPVKGSPVRGAATDQQLGAAGTRAATHASLAAQQVPVASRGAVAGTVKAAAAAAMKRASRDSRVVRDSGIGSSHNAGARYGAPARFNAGQLGRRTDGAADEGPHAEAPSWPVASEEGCVLLRPRRGAGALMASGAPAASFHGHGGGGGGGTDDAASSSAGCSLSMRALGEAARSMGSGSMGRRSSEAGSHRYSQGESDDEAAAGCRGQGGLAGVAHDAVNSLGARDGRGVPAATTEDGQWLEGAQRGRRGAPAGAAYDWTHQQSQNDQLLAQLQQLEQQQEGRQAGCLVSAAVAHHQREQRQQHQQQQGRQHRSRYEQPRSSRASSGAARAHALPSHVSAAPVGASGPEGAAVPVVEHRGRVVGASSAHLSPVKEEADQASRSLLASPGGRPSAARTLRLRPAPLTRGAVPGQPRHPGSGDVGGGISGGRTTGGSGGGGGSGSGGGSVSFQMADAIAAMGTADPRQAAALINLVADPLTTTRLMRHA